MLCRQPPRNYRAPADRSYCNLSELVLLLLLLTCAIKGI